jgi:hypothetical protein
MRLLSSLRRGAAVVVLTGLLSTPALSQETKFKALVPLDFESMGAGNALSGDVVALHGTHKIYVFHLLSSGWHQMKILTPQQPALCSSLNCGTEMWGNVAVDGPTLVGGGSYWVNPGSTPYYWGGTLTVWERNLPTSNFWGVRKVITSGDAGLATTTAGNSWAEAAELQGDYAFAGDYLRNRVDIFKRHHGGPNNWGFLKTLVAHTPTPDDYFGDLLEAHSNLLLVSANYDDTVATNAGAAYLYERDLSVVDNWGLRAMLAPSDLSTGDLFAASMDLYGTVAVVGAMGQKVGRGAVYIFEMNEGGTNQWGQSKKLTLPGAEADERFGYRVSTDGSYVVVSARGTSDYEGVVHVYHRDEGGPGNWGHRVSLTASDPMTWHMFGLSDLSMSPYRVLVSATGDVPGGAAYLYEQMSLDSLIIASKSAIATGDTLVDFDSTTAVDIQFADADSGRVTVQRFDSPPLNVSGVPEPYVFDNHWLISGDSVQSFSPTTEVRFSFPEIPDPGFSDPSDIVLYKRPGYGGGPFTAVPTSFNGSEIVGTGFTSFSEFIMASTTALPVELTEFSAIADGDRVTLRWRTASERDNAGFEIEHRYAAEVFDPVGFVEGHGTSDAPHAYQFTVADLDPGFHRFRLKQVDLDGSFSYSEEVEALSELATGYALESAYPNPFNPTTTIKFALAARQEVDLALFDLRGQRVRDLYRGVVEANRTTTVCIDCTGMASGTYYVRLTGRSFAATKEIVLVK